MPSFSEGFSPLSKFKLSRRGRKLQTYDDQRVVLALPKDVPERIWAEIIAKEETELMILDLREEIVETALDIGYENYMTKQTTFFTSHCAAKAWLKLIDWAFYRHDPGEDPSSYPPCYIPNRKESWTPDAMPAPSPKDTWCKETLPCSSPPEEEKSAPTYSSLDLQVVEDIPKEYWFPGKITWPQDSVEITEPSYFDGSSSLTITTDDNLGAESEVLQKVTDYSTDMSEKDVSVSPLKPTPVDSLRGAGDGSTKDKFKRVRSYRESMSRSKMSLSPKDDSRSRISFISDCRLRNLRLETQYEITSEKVESSTGEPAKRK